MQAEMEHKPPLPLLGALPVSISLLEELFCLPPGYSIASVSYDPWNLIVTFVLAYGTVPAEVPNRDDLPQLQLHATVETLPDMPPEYRKITTEVNVQ